MEETNQMFEYIIPSEIEMISPDNLLDEITHALEPELRLNAEPKNWRHLYTLAREMNNFTYGNSEAHAMRAGQIISLAVTLWDMFKRARDLARNQHIEIRGLKRQLQQASAELETVNSAITDAQDQIVILRETITEQEKALASYQQETDELRREIVELSQQPQNENYRAGYVYLIAASNGTYKIGRTKNPEDRMKTFGLRLPFHVEYVAVVQTEDMYSLEKELHKRFKKKRLNGSEFFQLVEDDVNYIIAQAHETRT